MACCCAQPATEVESVTPQSVFDKEEAKTEPGASAAKEPVTDFAVVLAKSGGQALGINLGQKEGGNTIFVESISESGAAATYNAGAETDKQIEIGDVIVVNGCAVAEMLQKLQEDGDADITVMKAKRSTITITKDVKLGMDLVYDQQKSYLIVKAIQDDGSVKTHNAQASKDQQVNVTDRIVAVDGFRGIAKELFDKLQASGSTVELTMLADPRA